MTPDFNQKTIDTVAKRAAYRFSNPDCRILTVDPNSDVDKATVVGEAAHIRGARAGAKRYDSRMADVARAEITNSIWLCRNCHKLVDSDERLFTVELLYMWREDHERHTQSEPGTASDRITYEHEIQRLRKLEDYPLIARRISIDKPLGWEFRLAAELMRHYNKPLLRKLEDLKDGLYIKGRRHISDDEVTNWVGARLAETENLVEPFKHLFKRLTDSFGPPGQAGDEEEIHHITKLISEHVAEIVRYEEEISFIVVSEKYQGLISLFKNLLGSHVTKLKDIPDFLDEVVAIIMNGERLKAPQ
jgi:hypothetical protein